MHTKTNLSLKRYRFTNKERDDETGLYYFGVRYYAAWLGRWTSSDPGGFLDGLNVYVYTRNNPVGLVDEEGYVAEEPEKKKEVEGSAVSDGTDGDEKKPGGWTPYDKKGNIVDVGKEGWEDSVAEYKWSEHDIVVGYEYKGKVYKDTSKIAGYGTVLSPDSVKEVKTSKAVTVEEAFVRHFDSDGNYVSKTVYQKDGKTVNYPTFNVSDMKVSDEMASYIASYESFSEKPHNLGGWAVGYGHAIDLQKWGGVDKKISKSDALSLLFSDLDKISKTYFSDLGVERLTQQEYDALFSIAFNSGPAGAMKKDLSISIKRDGINVVNASNVDTIFTNTITPSNKIKYPGLIPRRKNEARIFGYGEYNNKANRYVGREKLTRDSLPKKLLN